MMARVVQSCCAAAMLALVAGCASKGGKPAAAASAAREPGATTAPEVRPESVATEGRTYRDPIARGALRERALTMLVSAATNGTPEERANAIEGLIAAPGRLVPVLDAALTDPNVGVRSVAAMAIGRAQIAAAAPRLRPLLSDPSFLVRSSAMYGLKRCGMDVDLTPMASMLMDLSPRVRAQAAFLLGELGESSAVALLKDAGRKNMSMADAAEVRVMDLQMAEARVKLGDATTMPEIRAALFPAKPEDLEATALACQIVGGLRDTASANRLIELVRPIDDKKQVMPAEVRLSAASALAKLGQRHGAYIADQYRANKRDVLRAQAAIVYGDVGAPENMPLLVDLMNDPVGRVRVAAATAIIRIAEGPDADVTQANP